jgi:hypothetical protein
MNEHTKQQLENKTMGRVKQNIKINDFLRNYGLDEDSVLNMSNVQEVCEDIVDHFIQQAIKSQAEMIRAEMVPKRDIIKAKDAFTGECDFTMRDVKISYNSAIAVIESNLDELINSFK